MNKKDIMTRKRAKDRVMHDKDVKRQFEHILDYYENNNTFNAIDLTGNAIPENMKIYSEFFEDKHIFCVENNDKTVKKMQCSKSRYKNICKDATIVKGDFFEKASTLPEKHGLKWDLIKFDTTTELDSQLNYKEFSKLCKLISNNDIHKCKFFIEIMFSARKGLNGKSPIGATSHYIDAIREHCLKNGKTCTDIHTGRVKDRAHMRTFVVKIDNNTYKAREQLHTLEGGL